MTPFESLMFVLDHQMTWYLIVKVWIVVVASHELKKFDHVVVEA